MSEAKIVVGSFSSWLLFRCISLFMLAVGLAFIAANLYPLSWLPFGMGLFVSLISLASAHDFVYGFADEDGFHYRRYVAFRFVGWEQIAIISWAHADLVYFHLKDGRLPRVLRTQSFRNKSWAELLSEEPEVVRWLTLVKPAAADRIEIQYPRSTMPPRFRWNPLKASRTAQFMFVLAVVIWIFSIIYTHSVK
jgi:hypothetical protein